MTSFALSLPADVAAPAAARRSLDTLALPPHCRPDLLLLVSELVTNSVRHGAHPDGIVGMRIDLSPERIRVEVEDGGDGFVPPSPGEDPTGDGMGLRLVDTLSDRWGVTPVPATVVWFEVDLGPA
ncbi:MAG: ATP-binding protein [Acidimicrobiia bacterium]|jgi:anti-sigma regulatory factor (Ser/Thr protein kinase)